MMKAVTASGGNVGEFVYVGKGDGYGGRLRERAREEQYDDWVGGMAYGLRTPMAT